jgi:hypothetical protein
VTKTLRVRWNPLQRIRRTQIRINRENIRTHHYGHHHYWYYGFDPTAYNWDYYALTVRGEAPTKSRPDEFMLP